MKEEFGMMKDCIEMEKMDYIVDMGYIADKVHNFDMLDYYTYLDYFDMVGYYTYLDYFDMDKADFGDMVEIVVGTVCLV
jgi:hypothetical protein